MREVICLTAVGFDLPEDYFENDDYFLDIEEAHQLLEDERIK